ncbi:MAG: hypothetical protein PUF70_01365 [Absicoccus porci]|uniref:hypothetical protein n=1 Tax=Absicoccus porci TaxID=2486576 RepID=UPI002409F0D5|nr:hypothetical protein [Absicoccus porci]MDD6459320.1 hypothetical protein [Absicoccus porci]
MKYARIIGKIRFDASWQSHFTKCFTGSCRDVDDLLVRDLQEHGYTSNDIQIIAMVGEDDGTKGSMIPQIEALSNNHADLITNQNLIYWKMRMTVMIWILLKAKWNMVFQCCFDKN